MYVVVLGHVSCAHEHLHRACVGLVLLRRAAHVFVGCYKDCDKMHPVYNTKFTHLLLHFITLKREDPSFLRKYDARSQKTGILPQRLVFKSETFWKMWQLNQLISPALINSILFPDENRHCFPPTCQFDCVLSATSPPHPLPSKEGLMEGAVWVWVVAVARGARGEKEVKFGKLPSSGQSMGP